jgi:nucleoside diphosphate kinase
MFATRRCVSQTAGRVMARYGRRTFASSSVEGTGGGGGGGGIAALGLVAALAAGAGAGYAWYDSNEKLQVLQKDLDAMQVTMSGKTNSAFVFVKPHAAHSDKVKALLEETLKNNGIRITAQGEMQAGEIDRNMHIDTHYGAIASKAVKLKPYELNVPDKGQAEFEKLFGESWTSALNNGKVYNAKDGAAQLGLDSEGLNAKWSKLTPGKDLLKFGGGFYCGKIDNLYIMNGFYMSMRSAYTNPGEQICWYTVQWPSDALTWSDFRTVVLGSTDPSKAPPFSVRREIYDHYKTLGLTSKPNTGDNGVHASASPFEAMIERANWLKADIRTDELGKALLKKVPLETIVAWGQDCQVTVAGETADGKTVSVFDTLEDLDADTVLKKVDQIRTASK